MDPRARLSIAAMLGAVAGLALALVLGDEAFPSVAIPLLLLGGPVWPLLALLPRLRPALAVAAAFVLPLVVAANGTGLLANVLRGEVVAGTPGDRLQVALGFLTPAPLLVIVLFSPPIRALRAALVVAVAWVALAGAAWVDAFLDLRRQPGYGDLELSLFFASWVAATALLTAGVAWWIARRGRAARAAAG